MSHGNALLLGSLPSQDVYQELEICGWRSSRSIRWEGGFRQPTLDSIYRNRFNDDTCVWAKDGVCSDGGDGDYQPFAAAVFEPRSTRILSGNSAANEKVVFEFKRIESDVALPSVGTHVMISRVDFDDDGGASPHPSLIPENTCLHGGSANSQTGPLLVTQVDTYVDPQNAVPGSELYLGRIIAESIPGVTGFASNRAACAPCANVYACGTCDAYAVASNQANWESTHSISLAQPVPFDCMDVTGVLLTAVRKQCTYGSDRCAFSAAPACRALSDRSSHAGPTAATARTSSATATRARSTPRSRTTRPSGRSPRAATSRPSRPPEARSRTTGCAKTWAGRRTWARCLGCESPPLDPPSRVRRRPSSGRRDTGDCGVRHLTLPASKTGAKVPDDSCATAQNGRCEDFLYFSVLFPNGDRENEVAKCAPNTGALLCAPVASSRC